MPWDYTPGRTPPLRIADVQNDEQTTTRFVVVRGGPDKTGDFAVDHREMLFLKAA